MTADTQRDDQPAPLKPCPRFGRDPQVTGGYCHDCPVTAATCRDEWQRLADEATPGPWSLSGPWAAGFTVEGGEPDAFLIDCEDGGVPCFVNAADAEFVVAAREAVPSLLSENAALRSEVDRLRATVERVEAVPLSDAWGPAQTPAQSGYDAGWNDCRAAVRSALEGPDQP